jgi:sulfofructose kinase
MQRHPAIAAPPRLLCVGHAAIDHCYEIDTLPAPPAKVAARGHWCGVGGMAANAATAAARLGARVEFAGPVGADDAATRIAAHLAGEGIGAHALVRVTGTRSSESAVLVDARGERLIVSHRSAALQAAPAFDPGWLDGIDLVLADPRCPAWAEAALAGARARGRIGILDADVAPRDDLVRLTGLATWAVYSAPGLAAWSDAAPADALAAARAAGVAHAVVTLGEHGLLWLAPDAAAPRALPAYALGPVVDTTAAGDVFHGALGVALAEGREPETALRFASAAAALKCLRPGGTRGAPARAEVEALLAATHRV